MISFISSKTIKQHGEAVVRTLVLVNVTRAVAVVVLGLRSVVVVFEKFTVYNESLHTAYNLGGLLTALCCNIAGES
jgi:hypothetical protein